MTSDIDWKQLRDRAERFANDDAREDLDYEEWGETMSPWDVLALLARMESAERERDKWRLTVDENALARQRLADTLTTQRDAAVAKLDEMQNVIDNLHRGSDSLRADVMQLSGEHDAAVAEAERAQLAVQEWRNWSDEVAPPWGRTDDRSDEGQRELILQRMTALVRQDGALSERLAAVGAERDAAVAERDKALRERDMARASYDSETYRWSVEKRRAESAERDLAEARRERDEWRRSATVGLDELRERREHLAALNQELATQRDEVLRQLTAAQAALEMMREDRDSLIYGPTLDAGMTIAARDAARDEAERIAQAAEERAAGQSAHFQGAAAKAELLAFAADIRAGAHRGGGE